MSLEPPRISCEPEDWDYVARHVGCKVDQQTQRFVWRVLEPADAVRSTYDDNGPEELLRLGPPSLTKNLLDYQWEPMVRHWGLQVLHAAGSINGQAPAEYMSGFQSQGRLREQRRDAPLHPLLRRELWRDLTDEDWRLIQPGMHLATALLDESDVLRVSGAYFLGWMTTHSQALGHEVKVVAVPTFLSQDQIIALCRRLTQMTNYTYFFFMHNDQMTVNNEPCSGKTIPIEGDGWIPGQTCRSKIAMTSAFLDVFRLQQDPAEWEEYLNDHRTWHNADEDKKIHIDGPTGRLRPLFAFVQTILHELNHAVVMAAIPPDFNHISVEPFFPGDYKDECGYAFDKYIWNGRPDALTADAFDMDMNLVGPYGLQIYPDPTSWIPGAENVHGNQWQLPVQASWLCSLVSREFWEDTIQRFGASELRCPLVWNWANNPQPRQDL